MFNQAHKPGSVLTFGELLLRLCPDSNGNWFSTNRLPFHVGGAELNVATALALWQVPSKYFTALPDNGLSEQLLTYVGERGIDVSAVHKGGSRLGLFYLTQGKDMKHDAVIYDRAGSSFAELKTGVVDWDNVLDGVSWFHFSAICPALSQTTADLCEEALQAASVKGITISVDLNYRAKLWRYGKQPYEVMPALAKYCDLIMGNVWSAEKLLNISLTSDIHETGQRSIYLKEALLSSQEIMSRYPSCKAVANTFRFDHGKGIKYYTALYTDGQLYTSAVYDADHVVDKVGSGDCYMAGLIYGFYNRFPPFEIVNFATAAAFDKLFIEGDATISTVEKIGGLIKQNI
jgi:2-dehydro-3-deoxygluconokinase